MTIRRVRWPDGEKARLFALKNDNPEVSWEQIRRKYYPERTARALEEMYRIYARKLESGVIQASTPPPAAMAAAIPQKRQRLSRNNEASSNYPDDETGSDEDIEPSGKRIPNKAIEMTQVEWNRAPESFAQVPGWENPQNQPTFRQWAPTMATPPPWPPATNSSFLAVNTRNTEVPSNGAGNNSAFRSTVTASCPPETSQSTSPQAPTQTQPQGRGRPHTMNYEPASAENPRNRPLSTHPPIAFTGGIFQRPMDNVPSCPTTTADQPSEPTHSQPPPTTQGPFKERLAQCAEYSKIIAEIVEMGDETHARAEREKDRADQLQKKNESLEEELRQAQERAESVIQEFVVTIKDFMNNKPEFGKTVSDEKAHEDGT